MKYDNKIIQKNTPRNPSDIDLGMVQKATNMAGKLKEHAETLLLICKLVKDAATGKFDAPWGKVALLAATIAYVVCPIDLIPDITPIIGFVDDIAALLAAVSSASAVINAYKQWK